MMIICNVCTIQLTVWCGKEWKFYFWKIILINFLIFSEKEFHKYEEEEPFCCVVWLQIVFMGGFALSQFLVNVFENKFFVLKCCIRVLVISGLIASGAGNVYLFAIAWWASYIFFKNCAEFLFVYIFVYLFVYIFLGLLWRLHLQPLICWWFLMY